jgi:hypothetical protein
MALGWERIRTGHYLWVRLSRAKYEAEHSMGGVFRRQRRFTSTNLLAVDESEDRKAGEH